MKRERRARKKKALQSVNPNRSTDFQRRCGRIAALINQYQAPDVYKALFVSDLWLPNVSSQVKHALAWVVAIASPRDAFTGKKAFRSYADFRQFLSDLYSLLPDLPSVEDYVPESDWGEIRYNWKGTIRGIFYGGAVERTPDFITAFELAHGDSDSACSDMDHALQAQDHFLQLIPASLAGPSSQIRPGHIEIPQEAFWEACVEALASFVQLPETQRISNRLVMQQGVTQIPDNLGQFIDWVMTGAALTGFAVEIDGTRVPVALRNAASTVIDHWSSSCGAAIHERIGDFAFKRFPDVIPGPTHIVTRHRRLPSLYSAAVLGGEKPLLIISLRENELHQIPSIHAELRQALSTRDWALQRVGQSGAIMIVGDSGPPTNLNNLTVLVILNRVWSAFGSVSVPRTTFRVLSLPDFVTIFDSVHDIDELNRFWEFLDENQAVSPYIGPSDQFAAFRDSDSILVDGAVQPSLLMLDPHWGSNWRHRELSKFWELAPPVFPDRPDTAWRVESIGDVCTLSARNQAAVATSITINGCTAQFLFSAEVRALESRDHRILDLLIECLPDSLAKRREQLEGSVGLHFGHVLTVIKVDPNAAASLNPHSHADQPLFSDWQLLSADENRELVVSVTANLQAVVRQLEEAIDSKFEVETLAAWLEGLATLIQVRQPPGVLAAIRNTASQRPRFTLETRERTVDVPDTPHPATPNPAHYKAARRDLAVTFKDLGIQEGRYELAEAKPLINAARDEFRARLHREISTFDRDSLIRFCIQQIEQLTARYDLSSMRFQISLNHEVSYDRTDALADAHNQFVQDSRNYRYLLECGLSLPAKGAQPANDELVVPLVARIDWLLVLYGAGDVLHYGIDVAGLEITHSFVPNVFYSRKLEQNENDFRQESAGFKLGLGLKAEDEVSPLRIDDPKWEELNAALATDGGVSLRDLMSVMHILQRWPSVIGDGELAFLYSASQNELVSTMVDSAENLTQSAAERVLDMITIEPDKIRRLLGKSTTEDDVPIWEHNKRSHRYMIRPLIKDRDGRLIWGAASVDRSRRVWQQTLSNGYLPAEFDWPAVRSVVRDVKQAQEKELEAVAAGIASRHTPYFLKGIDFKDRYSNKGFEDVGDFDVLAYWPNKGAWLAIECKYNQPAFCLKDARRLRDRMFGDTHRRGQLFKIHRRQSFLEGNLELLRELLGWPSAIADKAPTVFSAYVSREIHWWMRSPPYPVSCNFVRVDALDDFLSSTWPATDVRRPPG